MRPAHWAAVALCLLVLGGAASPALAQTTTPTAKPGQRAGSAPTPPARSISPDPRDPVTLPPPGVANPGQHRIPGATDKAVPDTLAPAGPGGLVQGVGGTGDSLTLATKRKGQVETTVKYAATDSIQFDVSGKVARLYNKANVDYGAMNLKAALITVNYGNNTMMAEGRRDSVKNRLEGRPVFKDKDGLYTAEKIAYNFKTKKGKISEAVTTQGEGYVSAAVIKKTPGNELYGLHGRYTTCNLEHPHFYIQASKMKVIPGEKVVTGPFNLVIGDVPTPLGFLFGFFPSPKGGRGSGVIIPTFGQAADRGYYLTNGGYYFAPNDYIGVRITGDFYAGNADVFPGGFGVTTDLSYLKRYTYQGNFNFNFTVRPTDKIIVQDGISASPEYIRPPSSQLYSLRWNHTPTPTPGGGVFSASVNMESNNASRLLSTNPRQYLSPSFNSSISYSKQIRNSPVNYRVQLTQSQVRQASGPGQMTFTLPSLGLGVARQYPYEWLGLEPRGRFYEQFSIDYNLTATNQVSNTLPGRSIDGGLDLLGGTTSSTVVPVNFSNVGTLLRNARNDINHRFNLTLGSYSVAKHFKLTPSIRYDENWYLQRLSYNYISAARAIRIDTARGLYRDYGYSGSLSLNTAFYGTAIIKGKKLEAIRHKVTPSLSYTYSPDLIAGNTNAYNEVALPGLTDANGLPLADRRFTRFLGSPLGGSRVSAVSFTLQNSVEMKVRNSADTTGTQPFKKVSLIDGLDFSTSYNFAADSLQLQPLRAEFRRQVGQHLNINSTANFNFYQRDSTGRLLRNYLVEAGRLARLTDASLSVRYEFNPAAGKRKSVVRREVAPSNLPVLGTPAPPAYYADYVDFDIPWTLSMAYNARYSPSAIPLRRGQERPPLLASNSLEVQGSVKLTENLQFTYSLGYDLVNQSITYPIFNFTRDLHCWQISGTWTPMGTTQGYFVTISPKSSLLQDLKLSRNRYVQYQ
jgi:hypothetical protein